MRLENKKVIALVDEDFEDLELWYPVLRLREEGATVNLVGKEANQKYIGKYGVPAESEYALMQKIMTVSLCQVDGHQIN